MIRKRNYLFHLSAVRKFEGAIRGFNSLLWFNPDLDLEIFV